MWDWGNGGQTRDFFTDPKLARVRDPTTFKITKKSFDSFQNHFKNFSPEDWKVSHTNKVQKLLLF